jgi:hypothetical protein
MLIWKINICPAQNLSDFKLNKGLKLKAQLYGMLTILVIQKYHNIGQRV